MKPGAAGFPRGLEPGPTAEPALAALLNELLQRRLREVIGADRFGGLGQLVDWRLGLVAGIDPACLSGRAQVLHPRLTRPECAMALALNTFLPWLVQLGRLRLAGGGGFVELHFGVRCPTGVRGSPPQIDVIASGPGGIVGAAVKVFDYLRPRRMGLSIGYRSLPVADGMERWAQLLREEAMFRYVDAGGLAKAAIGLGRIFTQRPARLLYLFLEPPGQGASAFAAHRAELAQVRDRVAGSAVTFSACSLHELWRGWCAEDTPVGVRAIAAELVHRYGVVMPR